MRPQTRLPPWVGEEVEMGRNGSWVALTLPTCSPSLFPTMPRHNLHKIAPLVKSLCAKHGIEYQEKPLLRALLDIVR